MSLASDEGTQLYQRSLDDPELVPIPETRSGQTPFFSPDGQQIAYDWHNGDETWDLRLIGLDGSGARVLVHRANEDFIYPIGWSPDGTRILTPRFPETIPSSITTSASSSESSKVPAA